MFDTYTINTAPHAKHFYSDFHEGFVHSYLSKFGFELSDIQKKYSSGQSVRSIKGVYIPDIRKVIAHILREWYSKSYTEIAKILKTDHATVIYLCRKASEHIQYGDERFMRLMEMA